MKINSIEELKALIIIEMKMYSIMYLEPCTLYLKGEKYIYYNIYYSNNVIRNVEPCIFQLKFEVSI